ncbi:MAG: polyprenyl diphosphate synthase [Planctomycetota bacterium]
MNHVLDTIDSRRFPQHIAIIMDGNGRWAEERRKPRIFGHQEGVNSVREITTECSKLHLKQLTLYAFSKENWKRPEAEVNFLMGMLQQFLTKERNTLMGNGTRLTSIGHIQELPSSVRKVLAETQAMTSANTGLNLCLALSYGGKTEIVDAVNSLLQERLKSGNTEPATEQELSKYMYQPEMIEPDLLIRTSGEMRFSNFLLWHISYTELYVTPCYWPAFRVEELHLAIKEYASRDRRFGDVKSKK